MSKGGRIVLTIKNKIIWATVTLASLLSIFVILYGQKTFNTLTLNNALETQVSYLMSVDAHFETALNRLTYPAEVVSQVVGMTQALAETPSTEADFTKWQKVLAPFIVDHYTLDSPEQNLTLYFLNDQGMLMPTCLTFKDNNQNGFLDAPTVNPAELDTQSIARLSAAKTDATLIWLSSVKHSRQNVSEQLYWRVAIPVPKNGERQKPNVFFVLQGPFSLLTKQLPKHPSDYSPAIALINPDGDYLIQTELFPFPTKGMLQPIPFKKMSDPGSGQNFEYGEQSSPENVLYTRLQKPMTTGWTLIYAFPQARLIQSGQQNSLFAWIIASIFVLVTTLIVMRITDYLDAPLKELIQYLETELPMLNSNVLSEDLLMRRDEIGILVRTFDALGKELLQRRTQLLEVKRLLEEQVAERNKALSQTNELLSESIARLDAQEEALQSIHQRLLRNLQAIESTQKQLIRNEKSSSMKFLAAGVAHELNTPIGNAITLASFLSQEEAALFDLLNAPYLEDSEVLIGNIVVMDNALNQLAHNLDHANEIVALLEAMVPDSAALQIERIHLSEFLSARMSQMLETATVPVQLKITCAPDIYISTDPNQLSMLLMPLVQNSLDHGFKHRSSGVITLTVTTSEDSLCIVYEDDGNGIPAVHRPHILTPFFTTHLGRHKGLGLNLAYNIASFYFKGHIEIVDTGLPGTRIDCHLHL